MHRGRILVSVAAGVLSMYGSAGVSHAQNVTAVRLFGSIVDERGNFVPNVELTLRRGNRTEGRSRSGDGGQFEFLKVPPGTVLIDAHRLGYKERTMEVVVGSTNLEQAVKLDLLSVPADIEAVVVEDSPGRLQEFIEHRKASKFGHFFDQNEIRARSPRYVSELFRTIPGARLSPTSAGTSKLLLRGCRPKIWLDGVMAQDAEIDEIIAPSEIAGIEIYPSWAGVPAQYMDRENRACGTVLIWSRQT
jgi:hypothetical protein